MAYRARVVVNNEEEFGFHVRTTTPVAEVIYHLDGEIVLSNEHGVVAIEMRESLFDLMVASCTLSLSCGSEFELQCKGKDAGTAFSRLEKVFNNELGWKFAAIDDASDGMSGPAPA